MPTWYALDAEDCSRLGLRHSTVASDLALGSSVRLCEFRFRVRLGPLSLDAYERFLPGEDAFAALFDLVRLCVSEELSFELRLVLAKEEVPALRVSAASTARLGRTTWLTMPPGERRRDADDARFPSETFALERARPPSPPLEVAA